MTEEQSLPKQFDYSEAEGRIYRYWEEKDVFSAKVDPERKPFCVVIPPPNVTGILHMGHVLDNVPQDIMTRWHRMRGFSALWIPGTDHAGIATQNVVKRQLDKEGTSKDELGREKFLERVWEWRQKHGSIIIEQLKRLGCSCDWSRERFTMDEQLSKAVLTAFIHYYERGLIYKGKRMINWCTKCLTALANDEVEHTERGGHLWHLRYPVAGEQGQHIVVATTRPETMLGDTAVAVNPDDERYRHLIGKNVLLPLQNREIPIIADSFVDPQFGTGLVKVTPAHDPNDYEMGLKHDLALVVVIAEDGTMTEAAGEAYAGLDRYEARKRVVADLEALELLEQIEKYKHSVGACYRCNSVVEPAVSEQWFVKMKPLAEEAKQAVVDGRIKVIPESEKNDYYHWLDSIQDWCISRQLWWGHRIPIYYCADCQNVMAKTEAPAQCDKCSGTSLSQDEDVLDTWFSSQLWPYSTLGWPYKTAELDYWYPNTWLMSGRDILFFWDARMIMSGLELMGDVPFRTLALHGMLRDEKGVKLSKSLGNSPDPLELFEKYGTDSIRAATIARYPMGRQDARCSEPVYQEGRSFVTKLWNSFRLLIMHAAGEPISFDSSKLELSAIEDRWLIARLGETVCTHDAFLEESNFLQAFDAVSTFFWNEYCDWYLEIIKPRLREGGASREKALQVALHCGRTLLKLFHPYVPFVTEELWQKLLELGISDAAALDEDCVALAVWPDPQNFAADEQASAPMRSMMSIVRGVRDVRHNLNLSPKAQMALKLSYLDPASAERLPLYQEITSNLGCISSLETYSSDQAPAGHLPYRFEGGVAYAELPSDLDTASLKERLEQKLEKLYKGLRSANACLGNQSFVASAPAEVVAESRQKADEYSQAIEKLKAFHQSL